MRTWVDYRVLRRHLSMERVLELIEYRPTSRRGPQLRGPCPFHTSTNHPRCFSVHLTKGLFHCFHCGAHGDQLDLWSQLHHISLRDAALDLGRHIDIRPLDRHPETR
jgi:DNA primase